MSEPLVVEFYKDEAAVPLAIVLTLHGGDNPASGSLNLAAFLLGVKKEITRGALDAGCLAARYIVWQAREAFDASAMQNEMTLLESTDIHPYQVIRVRLRQKAVILTIMEDQFSSTQELSEATQILTHAQIQFEIQALMPVG